MNSHKQQYILVVLLLMGSFIGANSFANNTSYVKQTILRLSRVLKIEHPKKRTAKLIDELHRSFDYKQFEKKVIIDAASNFSKNQYKRFSSAFQQMFERKIIALAKDPSLQCNDYDVKKGSSPLEIEVTCVQQKKSDAVVLHFSSPRRNKITDITFSGALLSRNYRGIINKILRRDGAEALIQRVENKSSDSLTTKSLL